MTAEADSNERRGVVLVGYRGTGKSTIGRLLAARLGLPFHDADLVLETRLGRSIGSVFLEHGEPAFRDREQEVLAHLTAGPPCVLSTGGGAVLRETNRRALRAFGFVVWLTAEPTVLAGRIGRDGANGRPALTAAGTLGEIAEVLAARTPLYREVADAVVETGARSRAEVVRSVIEKLPWREREQPRSAEISS